MRVPEEFTWRLAGRGTPFDASDAACVHGDPAAADRSPRVAVVAHFDPASRFGPSLTGVAHALVEVGFLPVVVTTSPEPPDPRGLPPSTVVVARPNRGYDFGSWTAGLRLLPTARCAAEVVLANDSMVGPFAPLDDLMGRAAASGADVWAATSSLQIAPHLQSYLLRFAPGVLDRPELVGFFDGIRHLDNKVAIVRRYELGLTRVIRRAGLRSAAGFPAGTLGAGRANPTTAAWRELMAAGYPFFKRTLLHDPRVRVERAVLAEAVRGIFGADLEQFLADVP